MCIFIRLACVSTGFFVSLFMHAWFYFSFFFFVPLGPCAHMMSSYPSPRYVRTDRYYEPQKNATFEAGASFTPSANGAKYRWLPQSVPPLFDESCTKLFSASLRRSASHAVA